MINELNKSRDIIILSLFKNERLSAIEISKRLNISAQIVRITLRKNGLKPLTNSKQKPPSLEQELHVIELYKQKLRKSKIAYITKVSYKLIPDIVKKHGIKVFYKQKKFQFIEDYFEEIDTESKSLMFGLMYSDGVVLKKANRIDFGLAISDIDTVQFFRSQIESNHEIKICKDRSGYRDICECQDQALISVYSKKMVEDLIGHGCVANKSLIKEFPIIRPDLLQSFTYGYFLGNGSISKTTRKTGRLAFEISISSNYKMCEEFKRLFSEILGINCYLKHDKRSHKDSRKLQIGGNQQIRKFVEWMIQGQPRAMERKNKSIDEFLEFMKNW